MGMLRTLALGVVGYGLYSTLRQRGRTRDAAAKPEPLQRWEGEGGNVPAANPSLRAVENIDESTSSVAAARSANPSGLN